MPHINTRTHAHIHTHIILIIMFVFFVCSLHLCKNVLYFLHCDLRRTSLNTSTPLDTVPPSLPRHWHQKDNIKGIWRPFPFTAAGSKNQKKVCEVYISPYCRQTPILPNVMKFGIRGQLIDVITCVKFLVNWFRGYGVLTPQNCHFPSTCCVALTTVYALPCDTVIPRQNVNNDG